MAPTDLMQVPQPAAKVVAAGWYVVHTKPRLEHVAMEQLQRQDFEVYLPMFRVFCKRRGRAGSRAVPGAAPLTTHEPMFPRYLFLRPTRATQSLSVVRSTLGVSRLVLFGQQPALLADAAVDVIRRAETARESAGLDEVSPYEPGMIVRIQNSPLAGAEALVRAVSKDRVTLLLNILGRPQTVQVGFGQVALP